MPAALVASRATKPQSSHNDANVDECWAVLPDAKGVNMTTGIRVRTVRNTTRCGEGELLGRYLKPPVVHATTSSSSLFHTLLSV